MLLSFVYCQAALNTTLVENNCPLRVSDDLCAEERESARARKKKMAKTFHTLIGADKEMCEEQVLATGI